MAATSVVRGRAPWIAVGVVVVIVGVIGLAQLTLPGIAAQRVRDQIGRYGAVRSAHVTASPAIELLWGDAQSASVTAGSLHMSFAQAAELLSSDGGFDRLDMTAQSLVLGSLTIGQAGIHKHGEAAYLEGNVELSGLRSLLPPGVEVQLVGSADGEVQIRLRGDLFGVPTSVPAVIGAEEGKLEVHSQPGALGLPTITLFSDPRFRIEGVEMSATKPGVYHVRMSGILH
jgi:hypothetical protein